MKLTGNTRARGYKSEIMIKIVMYNARAKKEDEEKKDEISSRNSNDNKRRVRFGFWERRKKKLK